MQSSDYLYPPSRFSYELPAKPDAVHPPQKSPKRTANMQSGGANKNMVETSSMVFDPNNSTPPSDFMNLLKQRMNVYFEPLDK
jgi:hypothetical protein